MGVSVRGVMGLLILLALGAGLSQGAALPVGRVAPDFVRLDLGHEKVHLAGFRGKVVLLNFWATWCAPCLEEMPRFAEWQRQYGSQGLQVIGVSMDDDAKPVEALRNKLRLDYPVLMGDERLGGIYGGVMGLPITYLIDRKGRIRGYFQGEKELGKMLGQVEELLRRP